MKLKGSNIVIFIGFIFVLFMIYQVYIFTQDYLGSYEHIVQPLTRSFVMDKETIRSFYQNDTMNVEQTDIVKEVSNRANSFGINDATNTGDILIITNGSKQMDVVFPEQDLVVDVNYCKNLVPGMKCKFVSSGKRILRRSDAVVFKPFNMRKGEVFNHTHHALDQKWVLVEHESPYRTWTKLNYNLNIWDKFNITWTYAQNSDILFNEYLFQCYPNPNWKPSGLNYARSKSGIALWIATNCIYTSRRELYVAELQKYIPVDMYGECAKKDICGHSSGSMNECTGAFISQYKFYLAFENSFCKDYVTEKISKTLQLDVIPIVMGLVNYTELLPPGTYINVRDFKSPEHLAKHLNYLNENETAYNEIIEQKRMYSCHGPRHVPNICTLCRYLHLHKGEVQVVSHIKEFWDVESNCVPPQKFFSGIADTIVNNATILGQLTEIGLYKNITNSEFKML